MTYIQRWKQVCPVLYYVRTMGRISVGTPKQEEEAVKVTE